MMKSFDISFALKQRVQADGGAVERDMDPAKKVESNSKYCREKKWIRVVVE